MQNEVAVTRLSSCECCIECIHRILEYAPMVLAYRGPLVRCVRHVYGDLHREDLPVQPFPRCRRCFFCRHAVMFELSSPKRQRCLVALAPLFCASVWFCWLVLDAPSVIPVSIHASSAPCRLHTSSVHSSPSLVIPRHSRHSRHYRHFRHPSPVPPPILLTSTPPKHPRIFRLTSE